MNPSSSTPAFSVGQARHIVKDLFTPNPAIYWADMLISAIVGMTCFTLVRRVLTPWSIEQGIFFVASCLLFYRAVLFTHELVHMRDGTFRYFRIVWNLLVGIPMLTPSFMYYTHVEHHMRKHFGTHHDGEYLALGTTSPRHILIYLCQPFVLPILAVVRFLILAPISWVSPRSRDFVHRHASSMVMDPSYIRPLPTRKVLAIFRLQEVLCFMWLVGIIVMMIIGVVPIWLIPVAYAMSVVILSLNALRTLGAHRYTNTGDEVTFVGQLLDSVNYPRWPLITALWAPLGLRFHALHHLFPSLPYHNLTKAHARLMAELPADSPYRQTESASLIAAIAQLWRTSKASTSDGQLHGHSRPLSTGSSRMTSAH